MTLAVAEMRAPECRFASRLLGTRRRRRMSVNIALLLRVAPILSDAPSIGH
jgi:hypothetical protein